MYSETWLKAGIHRPSAGRRPGTYKPHFYDMANRVVQVVRKSLNQGMSEEEAAVSAFAMDGENLDNLDLEF